ncbi:MAG: hypothetical protein Q7J35_16075 [Candidatus Methanoperedens sp.]|nr:hypothetical protein [Candidatus Methanoperedens sp.]
MSFRVVKATICSISYKSNYVNILIIKNVGGKYLENNLCFVNVSNYAAFAANNLKDYVMREHKSSKQGMTYYAGYETYHMEINKGYGRNI